MPDASYANSAGVSCINRRRVARNDWVATSATRLRIGDYRWIDKSSLASARLLQAKRTQRDRAKMICFRWKNWN
jgi:hypothetical protein